MEAKATPLTGWQTGLPVAAAETLYCKQCLSHDCTALLVRRGMPSHLATRVEHCLGKLLHTPPAALAAQHSLASLRKLSGRGLGNHALGDGSLYGLALALFAEGHQLKHLFVVDFLRMQSGAMVGGGAHTHLVPCAFCHANAWLKPSNGDESGCYVHVVGFDASTSNMRLVALLKAPACKPEAAP